MSSPVFPGLRLLRQVHSFAGLKKYKLYLVGGILRDALLGREKENPDFDFAVKRNAIGFGRALAKELRAGFVVLDKGHGACRVVKKRAGKIYTLDFTDFRGKTLEKDLLHRDFTINAMALELEMAFKKGGLDNFLIDPYSGKDDLKKKIMRAVHKGAFTEDPLRVLRAFSFSCLLGFEIDKDSLALLKKEKAKLTKVSFERIRDELFKIFAADNTYECFLRLDKLGILKIIFPETLKMRGIGQGPYHHLDVWQHTLETMRQMEFLLREKKNNEDIRIFLSETISAERKRKALIKLAAFLHDIGKPAALRCIEGKLIFHGHERIGRRMAEEICRRLKLSNDEIASLKTIVLWHLRPGFMADIKELSARAKFRYFRDAGKEAVSILLLSVADQRATKGPLTTRASRMRHEKVVFGLINEYFRQKKEEKPTRLLNGDDLIRKFKLEPSKLIGSVLSDLEELQAIGKIRSRQEAFQAANRLIKSKQ